MKKVQFVSQLATFMLLLSACSLPLSSRQPADTQTPEAVAPPPVVDAPASIPHELVPISLPSERANQASDQDSSETASRRYPPGGDRFSRGDFERPFNANTMDVYFPYLDIIDTRVFEDDTWLYASITLRGMDQDQSLPGQYLMEIDQDRDGRGDWLVGVTNPSSTEWTSEGVRVWHDNNDDVGGNAAFLADDNPPYSDGYELLVYDEGKGEIPDAAFAQRDQKDPDTVLIAIQKALFDGDTRLLVGMWAGSNIDPALFDLNDHFTHEQAGAADPGLEIFYPIKSLAELDNTCRMAVGFQPTGAEPGVCSVPAAPGAPGCQLSPGSCSQGTFFNSANCSCDYYTIN